MRFEAHLRDVKRQVRLSTKRYSRAKFAVSRHAELEIRTTQCLLHSVVKEHPFAAHSFRPKRLRARRSAILVWSQYREKTCREKTRYKIKNPATSAGRIRPFLWVAARCAPRTDVLEAR
jgi:hypothetical protein